MQQPVCKRVHACACCVQQCVRHFPLAVSPLVTNSDTHLDNDTQTQTSNTFRLYTCPATQSFSLFVSPTVACANAPSQRHIGLDYNLICSGRDGVEHQIIPNEENQSHRVQISWKLVNSDWFRQSSRQGGIWQITASQVVREREERREEERENGKTERHSQWSKKTEVLINWWSKKKTGSIAAKRMSNFKGRNI